MTQHGTEPDGAGRRERGKRDKHARIVAAARALLAADGFEATTVQRIADRADVAVGTVFRYASNKSELLLLALAPELDAALDRGIADAVDVPDPADAVVALLAPVLDWGLALGPTMLAFQREVLFEDAGERYHQESVASSLRVEHELAALLDARGTADPAPRARLLFDASQMELSRALQTGAAPETLLDTIRAQARTVLRP